ncbi:MAG: hypothetical protein UY50_C0025G0021 [Parcubacteria group bacterium GW2011_GWA2_49_9]|nr:MAG: hypothetical protein UY50_C0025G0021 [Parcubacteria group bacterium GW2011_GWA2_49_9]
MKIKKNQMGFSGIEALIAIVIIAIVGALFAIEAGGRRLMLAEGRGYPVSTRQLSHNSAYSLLRNLWRREDTLECQICRQLESRSCKLTHL